MKKVALLLANGFEETEALVPADMLVRAGIDVVKVGVCDILDKPVLITDGKFCIEGSHRLNMYIDISKDDCKLLDEITFTQLCEYDGVILPGGIRGAKNLKASNLVKRLLEYFNNTGKLIAAICASPAVVLAKNGIIKSGKHTAICYPGCEELSGISDKSVLKTLFSGAPEPRKGVCHSSDSNIITAKAAGASFEFAFEIISYLANSDQKATEIKDQVYYN